MAQILKDEKIRGELLKAIREAQREVLIATYKMGYNGRASKRHLNALVEALHQASKRGVQVRCLLNMDRENTQIGRINARASRLLEKRGVITRKGQRGRTIHAKLVIIDEEMIIVGSHNLSESSLCRNFEVSLLIRDPIIALDLKQIYQKEWERGRPNKGL